MPVRAELSPLRTSSLSSSIIQPFPRTQQGIPSWKPCGHSIPSEQLPTQRLERAPRSGRSIYGPCQRLFACACVRARLIFPVSPPRNSPVKERGSVGSQGGTRLCFLMRISTLTRQARIPHRTVTRPLRGWDFHMLGKKEKVRGRRRDRGGGRGV